MASPSAVAQTVSAQRRIAAPADVIFNLLADPSRHSMIDGSGTLVGDASGPHRLALGDTFTMGMHNGLSYRSTNRVVTFVEAREIAWETVTVVRGREFGGQRWGYELLPDPLAGDDPSSTLVRHSVDFATATGAALMTRLGYPRRARLDLAKTLDRLADVVTH